MSILNFKGFLTVNNPNNFIFAVIFAEIQEKLKTVAVIFLSLSMSLAIMGPSLLTIFDLNSTSIALVELTEEEQQQKTKQSPEEDKISQNLNVDFGFGSSERRNKSFIYYKKGSSAYTREVHLPPPEQIT